MQRYQLRNLCVEIFRPHAKFTIVWIPIQILHTLSYFLKKLNLLLFSSADFSSVVSSELSSESLYSSESSLCVELGLSVVLLGTGLTFSLFFLEALPL